MRFITMALITLAGCTIENAFDNEIPGAPVSNPPGEDNTQTADRYIQIQQPSVDVLFVVDNSSSMFDEQQALQQNFPLMMEYFEESGLDYHIGLVATDAVQPTYSGSLMAYQGTRYITSHTENPAAVFTGMTGRLGVLTGSVEAGRAAAYQALELYRDTPRNEGFYRDEAELHIIFVSDANDQSYGSPISFPEFMNWARNLKSPSDRTTMHAIVVLPSDPNSCSSTRVGQDYLNYASASDGIVQSICETDWAPALDALGLQTTGLKQEFFLTRTPVIDPLTVRVRVRFPSAEDNGQAVTLAFDVCMAGEELENPDCQVVYSQGRNSVTFLEYVADPLAEVLVDYTRREDYSADNEILQ